MFASRSFVIAVLSALAVLPSVVTGFAVLPTTTTAVRTPSMTILAAVGQQPMDQNDEDAFVPIDEVQEGDIFFAMEETDESTTTTTTTIDDKLDSVKATLKDLTGKVQTFAQDERVKDISVKAADFAKDVMGQLFKPVGEKLKELKKEKEQANN